MTSLEESVLGLMTRGLTARAAVRAVLEQKLNAATVPLEEARAYAEEEFARAGLDLDEVLPDFDANYLELQALYKDARPIPRYLMPVIEPEDMDEFRRKLVAGHIDIFAPYAWPGLFSRRFPPPKELRGQRGKDWVTLGLKDGSPTDDVIPARIVSIPARELRPTQDQLWLDLVVRYLIEYGTPETGSPVTDTPIIASRERRILDGHHRHAQVMLADPSLEMRVLLVPLPLDLLLELGRSYAAAIGRTPNV
jgi:hypothetical protein